MGIKIRYPLSMTNPFAKQPHDLGVKYIEPANPTDPRVPLPREFSLSEEITIGLYTSSRISGWQVQPKITPGVQNRIRIQGEANLKIYPELLKIDTQIVLPALGNTTAIIRKDDFLSVVGLAAEVGQAHDPTLGKVGFRYRDPVADTIQVIEKENARRYRAFWLIALNNAPVTPEDILRLISQETNGERRLSILGRSENGFLLGEEIRLFAMDTNWSTGLSYTIIPNSIEVLPIAAVNRAINYQEEGYTYGYQQEEPISPLFIRYFPTHARSHLEITAKQRLNEICRGVPGWGSRYKRTVKNLTSGQFGGNPGKSGEAAGSPNGGVCLANDQRVAFSNEAVLQTLGVVVVNAGNDGNGRALVAVGLNTNAPQGSKFSENRNDHKIYTFSGQEQSSFGRFSNLGGSGALQWVATENSNIQPGDRVFFVPAINYPAGSGLNVPFTAIERAWLSGLAISPGNIRYGATDDLSDYQDPLENELYILIYGTERAAIHYIYKKIQVATSSTGVATIPITERGCFAFIRGVMGRIDAPVVTGLTPNTSYDALCYYPPRSLETWQLQMVYPEYQGQGITQENFLDEAVIVTPPIAFFHSSGGALSVHRGDADLQNSPIGMHLPELPNSAIANYHLNTPIQFLGEIYPGPVTWREAQLISAPGLAMPTPGQKIRVTDNPGVSYTKSISAALSVNGQKLGCKVPAISSGRPYQAVIAFVVEKGKEMRLVVATQNVPGDKFTTIEFDSNAKTAIDIFYL